MIVCDDCGRVLPKEREAALADPTVLGLLCEPCGIRQGIHAALADAFNNDQLELLLSAAYTLALELSQNILDQYTPEVLLPYVLEWKIIRLEAFHREHFSTKAK